MKTAIVLACDDNYIPFTAVVARRIARQATVSVPIIVISDNVSEKNKDLAQLFCPEIDFIEASHFLEAGSLPVDGRITRAAHLRLFLDEILAGYERAVYLDGDISLLADVSRLLAVEPSSSPVIAAYDLHLTIDGSYRDRLGMKGPYFNSGILVLDLKEIRAQGTFKEARRFAIAESARCAMHDQDALNAVLDGRWQVLDWRWNAMNYLSELLPREPFIRHFAGCKPWTPKKVGVERRFVDEWRSDLAESPWPGRFHEEALIHRIRNFLSPMTSGAKTLIYRNASGKRGSRARLAGNLASVLSIIEHAAAERKLAGLLNLAQA